MLCIVIYKLSVYFTVYIQYIYIQYLWIYLNNFHDSYIKDVSSYSIRKQLHHDKSIDLTKESIEKYDAIVISTNHSNIDYSLIASSAKVIIDTRNAMNNTPVNGYIIKA